MAVIILQAVAHGKRGLYRVIEDVVDSRRFKIPSHIKVNKGDRIYIRGQLNNKDIIDPVIEVSFQETSRE